jgi:iron complex outermembrane receptor protein
LGADAAAQYQLYLSQGIAVVGAPPANVTVFVDGRSQNLGVSITRGFDFAADYDWQLTDSDRLALNIGGTYLTKYRVAVTPVAPLLNQLNRIFNPLRFKMRSSLTWEHDQFSARIQWIHINGYKNTVASPVQNVDSFNPVDLSLSWRIGDRGAAGFFEKGLTFGLEVRNLLDERPPYVNIAPSGNGSGGYDATAADPIGRVFSASVRKTF